MDTSSGTPAVQWLSKPELGVKSTTEAQVILFLRALCDFAAGVKLTPRTISPMRGILESGVPYTRFEAIQDILARSNASTSAPTTDTTVLDPSAAARDADRRTLYSGTYSAVVVFPPAVTMSRSHLQCIVGAIDAFDEIIEYSNECMRHFPSSATIRSFHQQLELEAARHYLVCNDVGKMLEHVSSHMITLKSGDPICDAVRYIESVYIPAAVTAQEKRAGGRT